jgi:hypothetical protein
VTVIIIVYTYLLAMRTIASLLSPRDTNYFPTRSGGKYLVSRGTINLLLSE